MANEARLTRLRGLTKALFALGLVLLCVPFIASLMPADADRQNNSPWEIEIALSTIPAGEIERLQWPGGPVWVLHRSPAQLAALAANQWPLADPDSQHSRQPQAARNPWRSLRKRYFVFIPLETSRNCSVRPAVASARGPEGFDEACEGARFDLAGRILAGTGGKGQENLPVPSHRYVAPERIRLMAP